MKIHLNESNIRDIIFESLTKTEISSMISNKFKDEINSREFKKKIKEIATDVVNEIFKILWQRNSLWKSAVVNS